MTTGRLVVLVLALTGGPALAQESRNVYLAQAKVFYQGLDFEKCVQRLEQAARWKNNTRSDLVEIELYSGLCKFNLHQEADAADHFEVALQLDPNVKLPPFSSPRVSELFRSVAARVKPMDSGTATAGNSTQPDNTQMNKPPPPPKKDTPVAVKLTPNPRPTPDVKLEATREGRSWALPLGLGGASVAAATVGIVFGMQAKAHEAQFNAPETFQSDADRLEQQARGEVLLANIGFGVASAAAIGAVVTYLLDE